MRKRYVLLISRNIRIRSGGYPLNGLSQDYGLKTIFRKTILALTFDVNLIRVKFRIRKAGQLASILEHF